MSTTNTDGQTEKPGNYCLYCKISPRHKMDSKKVKLFNKIIHSFPHFVILSWFQNEASIISIPNHRALSEAWKEPKI